MRAASSKSQPDERCPDCRGGLVCAEPWEAWFSRRDDAEADWFAEHGSAAGFTLPEALRDEQPDCEPDIECATCGGTGLNVKIRRSRDGNHRQTRAA